MLPLDPPYNLSYVLVSCINVFFVHLPVLRILYNLFHRRNIDASQPPRRPVQAQLNLASGLLTLFARRSLIKVLFY